MAKKRNEDLAASTEPSGATTPNKSPAGLTNDSGATPVDVPVEKKKTPWFRFTVMILFGVVYAWNLFSALSNFFGLQADLARKNEVRVLNGFSLIDFPWLPIIVYMVLPLAVFGLAVWIARRRSVGMLAVMLFAGLGVVAAVSLSLIAYVRAIVPVF